MTDTLTAPLIERPDDGLAIINITGILDEDAGIRGTLAILAAQDRRHVALDLTNTWSAAPSAVQSLARHVPAWRAEGGDLYLIGAPRGMAEALKVRGFKNRESWERFGGIRLMPKPHPTRYTPTDRVLADAEVFYGVPIVEIGEEGELILALGHHEPRRFYAALRAHARVHSSYPEDYLLDEVRDLAAFAQNATTWHVIYTHATRATLGNALPGDNPEWCVCDEGGGWYANTATEGTAHAVPTMTYAIGG